MTRYRIFSLRSQRRYCATYTQLPIDLRADGSYCPVCVHAAQSFENALYGCAIPTCCHSPSSAGRQNNSRHPSFEGGGNLCCRDICKDKSKDVQVRCIVFLSKITWTVTYTLPQFWNRSTRVPVPVFGTLWSKYYL